MTLRSRIEDVVIKIAFLKLLYRQCPKVGGGAVGQWDGHKVLHLGCCGSPRSASGCDYVNKVNKVMFILGEDDHISRNCVIKVCLVFPY